MHKFFKTNTDKSLKRIELFFLKKFKMLRKFKILNFLFLIIENVMSFQIMNISGEAAYYFIMSFFPFLFLLVLIIPLLPINFTPVINFIQTNIPTYLQPIFDGSFSAFSDNIHKSTISLGIVILIFSSSSATSLIIRNLNLIYKSDLTRNTILDRIWSIIINFIIILIIFSFAIFAVSIDDILNLLSAIIKVDLKPTVNIIEFLIIPLFIFIIVLLINYFSVPKRMKIKNIYIGSIFTSIALIGSLFAFNLYLTRFNHYAIYGFVGTFIILLLYFYIIAFVVLLGAIINRVIIDLRQNKNKKVD